MEFTGEYAAACERLQELAVRKYELAADCEEKGFPNAASDHRIVAKAFAMAIRALQGLDATEYGPRELTEAR